MQKNLEDDTLIDQAPCSTGYLFSITSSLYETNFNPVSPENLMINYGFI